MQEVQAVASFWERYQTGIVGAVGFVFVIITLVVNSRLAKRERIAALNEERNAMRVALLEELKTNQTAMRQGIKLIDKALPKNQSVLVPTDTLSSVYKAFLPRIGLVPELVPKLMDVYLRLETMHQNTMVLPNAEIRHEHKILVQHGTLPELKTVMEKMATKIDDAIVAVEAYQPARK